MVTQAYEPIYAEDSEELDDFPLKEGLTRREKKEAEFLYSIARAPMLVTGEPGSGKDLFGVALTMMNKYYFGRTALLDFYPRKTFGFYRFFNEMNIVGEIDKMAKAAKMEKFQTSLDEQESDFLKETTTKWVTEGEGETLFKNNVWYLSELKRYCYNRNPHSPINKFVGSICTVWRHLDLLIIGTHINAHEIDQYSFLSYIKHRARCDWSTTRPHTTDVTLRRGAFIGAAGVFNLEGKKRIIHVDGKKPRKFLDGNCFYDLYVTKNMVNLKPTLRKDM